MNPFKTIREKYKELCVKSVWRVVLNKYFIATTVLICIMAFGRNSFGDYFKASRILHRQEREISAHKKSISETESRINQLKSNKDTLERFAREQYYFVKDGEDLYIVK